MPSSRRRAHGFSLLEVLAAVAVLALVYVALAGSAMDGLIDEGTSRRRIEASLLADRELSDLELAFPNVPPPGVDEREDDIFRIAIEVEPFDLPLEAYRSDEAGPAPVLLADFTGDQQSPLRRIQVKVRWDEGVHEYEVVRTTFAVDLTTIDPALLAPSAGPGGGAGADGDGSDRVDDGDPDA